MLRLMDEDEDSLKKIKIKSGVFGYEERYSVLPLAAKSERGVFDSPITYLVPPARLLCISFSTNVIPFPTPV